MLAAVHPLAILAAMAHTTIYLVCEFSSFPSAATLRTGTGCDVDYTFLHMKNIGRNIGSGSPTATPLSAITDTLPGFSGRSRALRLPRPSMARWATASVAPSDPTVTHPRLAGLVRFPCSSAL